MKIGHVFPSEFLKSEDLGGIDGRPRRAVITDCKIWEDAQGNRKLNIGFANSVKRMLLNKTNARTIAKAYGDETDQWTGKPIVVYVAMVQYMDEMVEAIRVRIPPPQPGANGQAERVATPLPEVAPVPQAPTPPAAPPVDDLDAFTSGLPGPDQWHDDIPF